MKIGITGATGHLGRLVISKIKEKVENKVLIGLARSPEKGKDLVIEIREADYEKPETLSKALKGIDTLLLISASEIGKRETQHKNIIKAAKENDIKWIVYTSLLHANSTTLGLAAEHLATEEALKASGISYTILRNGWYTENYTVSVPQAIKTGALLGCAGSGRISMTARRDYADAAVAVLISGKHKGKTYELAGDNAYTLDDLAKEISRQTGKDILYKNLSRKAFAEALKDGGVPEEMSRIIAGWDFSASNDDLFDNKHQLSKLIGHPTAPLSDSVEEALKAL